MASISLIGGGTIKDYAHAAKVFRPNGFARAGKYKFLFHVFFNINPAVTSGTDMARELSFFVKKVDLPKFTVDTQVMNQYNRKQIIQKKINYQPINILFHDDNGNQIRELWRKYYNYYYADGVYGTSTYSYDDKYNATRLANQWGLESQSTPFFTSIDIYSLYAGKSFLVSLMNPVISSFNHDSHDYADNTGLMEHTMQISYTSVKYLEGSWAGTAGLADPSNYDTTPSSLTPNTAGQVYDYSTGNLTDPIGVMVDPTQAPAPGNFAKQQQIASANNSNPGNSSNINKLDAATILGSQAANPGPYVFPSPNPTPTPGYYGLSGTSGLETILSNPVTGAITENAILSNNNQYLGVYPTGSWQSVLEQQGYSTVNINMSQNAVNYALTNGLISNTAQAINLARQVIDNPSTVTSRIPTSFTPVAANYPVTFTNTSSIQPVYNASSWQQNLSDLGYADYEINQADNSLSNIRLSPEVDLQAYAIAFIERLRVNSAVK
jgi:hypothetical protein